MGSAVIFTDLCLIKDHAKPQECHSVGGSVSMSDQSNGQARPKMTNQLEHIRKEILPKVQKHKHAWPFQVRY